MKTLTKILGIAGFLGLTYLGVWKYAAPRVSFDVDTKVNKVGTEIYTSEIGDNYFDVVAREYREAGIKAPVDAYMSNFRKLNPDADTSKVLESGTKLVVPKDKQ